MNGYVTFRTRYQTWYTRRFPSYWFYWYGRMSLIAPLWTDIYGYSCNDPSPVSVVYYQQYVQYDPYNPPDDKTKHIMALAKLDVEDYAGDTSFTPSFVMVITWVKAIPYRRYKTDSQQATFQLVLISDRDTYRSYILFNYGDNSWYGYQRNHIGYQGNTFNRSTNYMDYYYNPERYYTWYNHPLSGSRFAFELNKIKGNTGQLGKYIFKVTTSETENDRGAEYRCRAWSKRQYANSNLRWKRWTRLPACPCQLWQAWRDPRYSLNWWEMCAVTRFKYGGTVAQKCCYGWMRWNLITTPNGDSGSFLLFNPRDYPSQHEKHDNAAKEDCCFRSNMCDEYYKHRPIDTCANYDPPFLGWFWGDPHINTLDGLEYDYNGVGEYWLIKADNFSLQARTTQAWNDNRDTVRATVFTAVASKDEQSSRAHVELSTDRERMMILVDDGSTNLTTWFYNITDDRDIDMDGVCFKKDNGVLVLSFASGIGLNLSVQANQISIGVTVTNDLKDQNTAGLFGVINDNPDDDLTLPDATTIVPPDSTPEYIYYNFGHHWRIQQADSLFWYDSLNDKSASSYQDPDFLPIFEVNWRDQEQQDQGVTLCGDNKNCQYDYFVTESSKAATSAKDIQDTNSASNEIMRNNIPVFDDVGIFNVTVGNTFTKTVSWNDADNDAVTVTLSGQPNGATFNDVTGVFSWNPVTDETVDDLMFSAIDARGATAVDLEVTVRMCNCTNGGVCMFDSLLESYNSTNRFQMVQCDCSPQWTGTFCELDFDGCDDNPCGELRNCTDLPADEHIRLDRAFNCSDCQSGYLLENGKCNDIDECDREPCSGTSACFNLPGSYRCDCLAGFIHANTTHCTDIDECALGTHNCDHICINTEGNYTCNCFPGNDLVDGRLCILQETLKEKCDNANCTGGCQSLNGSQEVECVCRNGYNLDNDGFTCNDVDECLLLSTPCGANGLCQNTLGSYLCSCNNGFKLDTTERGCDECENGTWGANCMEYCTCKDFDTVCDPVTGCTACQDGWTGGNCNEDINECLNAIEYCSPHSDCTNLVGTYTCTCHDGYKKELDNCTENDECESMPCANAGECIDLFQDYRCICQPGFTGKSCEIDIDECVSSPCQNDGQCTDKVARYDCRCTTGDFYGRHCQHGFLRNTMSWLMKFVILNYQFDEKLMDDASQLYQELDATLQSYLNAFYKPKYGIKFQKNDNFTFTKSEIGNIAVAHNIVFDKRYPITGHELIADFKKYLNLGVLAAYVEQIEIDPNSVVVTENDFDTPTYAGSFVVLNKPFDTAFSDVTNAEYKDLRDQIADLLTQFFAVTYSEDLIRLRNVTFTESNSLTQINYEVLFEGDFSEKADIMLEKFKSYLSNGGWLGTFQLDAETISFSRVQKEAVEPLPESDFIPALIGGLLGGIVLVAIIVCGVYLYCRHKKNSAGKKLLHNESDDVVAICIGDSTKDCQSNNLLAQADGTPPIERSVSRKISVPEVNLPNTPTASQCDLKAQVD